jgi:hypothetical protein
MQGIPSFYSPQIGYAAQTPSQQVATMSLQPSHNQPVAAIPHQQPRPWNQRQSTLVSRASKPKEHPKQSLKKQRRDEEMETEAHHSRKKAGIRQSRTDHLKNELEEKISELEAEKSKNNKLEMIIKDLRDEVRGNAPLSFYSSGNDPYPVGGIDPSRSTMSNTHYRSQSYSDATFAGNSSIPMVNIAPPPSSLPCKSSLVHMSDVENPIQRVRSHSTSWSSSYPPGYTVASSAVDDESSYGATSYQDQSFLEETTLNSVRGTSHHRTSFHQNAQTHDDDSQVQNFLDSQMFNEISFGNMLESLPINQALVQNAWNNEIHGQPQKRAIYLKELQTVIEAASREGSVVLPRGSAIDREPDRDVTHSMLFSGPPKDLQDD